MNPDSAQTALYLPTKYVKCARCGGQLRAVLSPEYLIVCDRCEYFTHAPVTHRQLIDDILGDQLCRS